MRSRPLSRATAFPGAGGCLKSSSASRKQTPGGSMTRRDESLKARHISFSELQENPSLPLTLSLHRPAWRTIWSTAPASIRFYMKYVAPEDIIVYSIDEGCSWMSLTTLATYKLSPHDLAMKIILDVLTTTGITATAGNWHKPLSLQSGDGYCRQAHSGR